jgi:hypothetical protein
MVNQERPSRGAITAKLSETTYRVLFIRSGTSQIKDMKATVTRHVTAGDC